jgi:hypothetical protein
MMRKINVLTPLCALLFALCGSVDAQQPKNREARQGFCLW